MARGLWTDEENALVVADYFEMLEAQDDGRDYVKSEHNESLRARINRTHGSIEYKHRNISAVLQVLGENWIEGYRPASNFQASLYPAVESRLRQRDDTVPDWGPGEDGALDDARKLTMGEPPRKPEDTEEAARISRVVGQSRKHNAAARAERNRKLGRAGERLVLGYERERLTTIDRHDLARRVRWVSEEDGDGAGYDIRSFWADGTPRLVEVKTTNGWERTPFYISRNELAVAKSRPAEWCLVRVWNFRGAPRAFELRPPLDVHLALEPVNFEVQLR
ncbi:MAG: DUF3883 domain-containing protein [Gammaproteobacteria bacterium]|nr:DUF3883 domain-containing protein [Gammaproteobacteria bacterium]